METINVVLKTGYKIVKDFSEAHKHVSTYYLGTEQTYYNCNLLKNREITKSQGNFLLPKKKFNR